MKSTDGSSGGGCGRPTSRCIRWSPIHAPMIYAPVRVTILMNMTEPGLMSRYRAKRFQWSIAHADQILSVHSS